MSFEHHQELVQGITAALKGLKLYPMKHPAIEQRNRTLINAFTQLFSTKKIIHIGLLEGTLFVEDTLFADDNPAAEALVKIFDDLDIEGFEFFSGFNQTQLELFLEIIMNPPGKGNEFVKFMNEHGPEQVKVASVEKIEEIQEDDSPRKVYGKALKVINDIFDDVRMGSIPSSDEAVGVVKNMARLTLEDPHALFALSLLRDYDNYTFTHSVNVSVLALSVGRACCVSEDELKALGLGGLLHDVGKMKVEVDIINKPGKLTDAEFEKIKEHPALGAEIVSQMDGEASSQDVLDIVRGHHVRHDRSGYPAAIQKQKISRLAEMTAIADAYDAMTTLRSYQNPVTPRKALGMLQKISGTAINAEYLERFAKSLGTYPVGTLVRIDSNEIGLVVSVGLKNPDDVVLKIIFGTVGEKLPETYLLDLKGIESKRIVGEVDPFVKGIEVTDYFDK
jgi:putative nucleotidyltransferase with HDIG domain